MSSEIVVQQEVNPLALLQAAIDKGASVEQLTVLMGLAERWEANQARKAFNVSFSEFKSEVVTLVKNQTVKDGPLKGKKYVDKFGAVDAITPALSKHGLSHSWKITKDEKDWIEVTCILRHALGHSESVSMGAAPDTGPGRNAIQARSSANSYLERITFLAVTGMAAADEDDDGNGGEAPKIAPTIPVQKKTDWSYNEETGVLICRPVSVEKRVTPHPKDPKEYAVVVLNGKAGENDRAFCFSATGISALLGSTGKIVRMVARPSKKGNYLNVEKLIDIDGKPFVDNELKVRELSLNLGLTEAELDQLVKDVCKGDWTDAKARLEAEQERRKEASNGAA